MLVDEKCAELARHFLNEVSGARPEDETELAEAIQRLCESCCNDIERSERSRRMDAQSYQDLIASGGIRD